jgi:tRNA(Arg) A34 adenosine deaminase TadA
VLAAILVAILMAMPQRPTAPVQQLARRRVLKVAAVLSASGWAQGATPTLADAMRRAEALRDEAVRAGDQPYGAVVLLDGRIVGEGPSRVVQRGDPTAHAEMEAIRDAARRLGRRDLGGALLVSTSRPCRMCEAAAGWAGIARMLHGQALTDAGPPR